MKRKVLHLLLVIAVTLALFLLAREAAYAERGYEAIGGEYMVFLLPLIFYAVRQSIADTRAALKEPLETEPEKEGMSYERHFYENP